MNARLSIALLLMAGAARTAGAQAPDSSQAWRGGLLAQQRAVSSVAFREGMGAAFTRFTTPDAVVLLDGAPVLSGADAARYLAAQAALQGTRVQYQPLAALVSPDGSLGATWGVSAFTQRGADTALARFSKYITMWRRSGGTWTIVAHVEGMPLGENLAVPAGLARRADEASVRSGPAAPFAQADRDFARMAGDSGAPAAFAAFAAPLGVTFPGSGEIMIGPAAIRGRMAENRNRTQWWWTPVIAGAAGDGSLGWTVGEARISAAGQPAPFFSKYLTLWRRLDDGAIRYLADNGNSRPADPAR